MRAPRTWILLAWACTLAWCRPGQAVGPLVPDLGTIRYDDPHLRRSLWLGLDLGGIYLPPQLGPLHREVWSLHADPAWALALTARLTAGGRLSSRWYGTSTVRLHLYTQEVEISGRLLATPGTNDRLAAGLETHSVDLIRVRRPNGTWNDFHVGGLDDLVLRLTYGQENELNERWQLAWGAQIRFAWVGNDTQRHLRASARLACALGQTQRLGFEGVGFLVHRDAMTFGRSLPPLTVHGQAAVEYDWLFAAPFVLVARAHLLSSFMTGEAPVYEIRDEGLRAPYGELVLGLRAAWD